MLDSLCSDKGLGNEWVILDTSKEQLHFFDNRKSRRKVVYRVELLLDDVTSWICLVTKEEALP